MRGRVKLEEIDKRFEWVVKRFEELRQDMNSRFEQIMDLFYLLAGIFASMVATMIGFAYWDRRVMGEVFVVL